VLPGRTAIRAGLIQFEDDGKDTSLGLPGAQVSTSDAFRFLVGVLISAIIDNGVCCEN
jgi:hypothetical protein